MSLIVKLVSGRILFMDVRIVTRLVATRVLVSIFMDSHFRAVRLKEAVPFSSCAEVSDVEKASWRSPLR